MIYKLLGRKNPNMDNDEVKFYAQAVCLNQLGIEELAERITSTCTVTRHDTLAVLSALQEQIIYALKEGTRIKLGDVGSFRIGLIGSGCAVKKEFDSSLIKRVKVYFTPNSKLKSALEIGSGKVTFEKVEFASADKGQDESGVEENEENLAE